jgi:peptidoglycan/LPS O-acetylase OafA/YrhL
MVSSLHKKNYRSDVQVLRGIAVISVVLFHASKNLFPQGYLGVDVFFIISGFVVTPLIMRIFSGQSTIKSSGQLNRLKDFYIRRFFRLAPALAVVLSTSALLIFFLGPVDDHQKFSSQGIASLLLMGNFGAYRYSESYFSPNPNPLIHTWSLSVEEQIYVLIPLLIILILKMSKTIESIERFYLILTIISFIFFVSPQLNQYFYNSFSIENPEEFSFYSPLNRIWQFTLGGLLYFRHKDGNANHKNYETVNKLLPILLIITLLGPVIINPKFNSICATLITCFIIQFKSLNKLPSNFFKILSWFGDRSYSIYLIHMPLLYVAKYSQVTDLNYSKHRVLESILAVIVTIFFGSLSYSFIENRYRNLDLRRSLKIKNWAWANFTFLAIPLVLYFLMYTSFNSKYLGLNKNIERPIAFWDTNQNCFNENVPTKPCVYNETGSVGKVMLIGDSHAAHIANAIVAASSNINYSTIIYALPGCKVRIRESTLIKVTDTCSQINGNLVQFIINNKPDIIIFSEYLKTNTPITELKETLLILKSYIPDILIIENNPIFLDDPFDRSIISMIFKPIPNKTISKFEMDNSYEQVSNELAIWAKNNEIFTLNLDSIFCRRNLCSRHSDKGWLYYNEDHFSLIGAELTIPEIEKKLNDLIKS